MEIAIHNAQMSYHTGGTERAIYDQIIHLLMISNENKITLITTKPEKESLMFKRLKKLSGKRLKIDEFATTDIGISTLKGENGPEGWHLESMRFGIITSRYYEEHNFDIVLVHFSTDVLFIPKKFKIVLFLHGVPSGFSSIDESSLLSASVIVYTTKNIKREFSNMYPFLSRKKSKVIYLGIEKRNFPLMERTVDLIFVGRLIRIKGVEFLIKAVRRLARKYPCINLHIVGKGPEEGRLKALSKSYNLGRNISFMSGISDEDLLKEYSKSKIIVIPSVAKEGIVLSMLEGALNGCCIIASDCCGMPEFVEHMKNGVLFKPRDYMDLSEKIELLLIDDQLREKLADSASKKIILSWTNESRMKELYNFLLEVKDG